MGIVHGLVLALSTEHPNCTRMRCWETILTRSWICRHSKTVGILLWTLGGLLRGQLELAENPPRNGMTSTCMRCPGVCRSLREVSAWLAPGLAGLAPPAGGGEELSSVA